MKPIKDNLALLTDLYQLTMIQAYFDDGRENDTAAFDYFFRKIPFGGGYVVFAGLSELLENIRNLKFTDSEIIYLKKIGFKSTFLDYLKEFSFKGDVFSFREGNIVFPEEPILSVRGKLIEAQLVESLLLNTLNFYSLIATKAARMRSVAGDKILGDFGLRRSHGLGGIQASKAAIIGGFDSTSNVLAAQLFDLKPVGTMAHSYIQSYSDELTAFRKYAESQPDNCTLLVDTYDTIKSGVPNAIKIAKELEAAGKKLKGIRLDSGDLISLAKQSRKMLDDNGLNYVKIVASNQLDEYMIEKIIKENAPVDIFGVGTNLVTGQPDAALDGVYKLSVVNDKPSLKLSESEEKITLPGLKQVFRFTDSNGMYAGDAIGLEAEDKIDNVFEHHNGNKIFNTEDLSMSKSLQKVIENGNIIIKPYSPEDSKIIIKENLKKLPEKYKKLKNVETYPVGISKNLLEELNSLKKKFE